MTFTGWTTGTSPSTPPPVSSLPSTPTTVIPATPDTGQPYPVQPNTGQPYPVQPNTGQPYSVQPTVVQPNLASNYAPPATPPPLLPDTDSSRQPGGDGGGRSTGMWVALVAVSVIAVAGVAFAAVSLLGDDADEVSTSTATTTTAVSVVTEQPAPTPTPDPTPAPTPTPDPTPAPPTTMAPVGALPPGLFCRDLNARGYSYSAAVEYWEGHGRTNDMDADKDGIPCATVYSREDVEAYWLPRLGYMPEAPTYNTGLPSGLLCRDLYNRGISVYGAIEYYFEHGAPGNMDADNDGIPCETVYPDAEEAYYDY